MNFKKGDIVVRTDDSNVPKIINERYHLLGAIFACVKEGNCANYGRGSMVSRHCRKATKDEIAWLEAGITNINQIPEVDGFYYNKMYNKRTIQGIDSRGGWIYSKETEGKTSTFKSFASTYIRSYKPPVKSQHIGNKVPIDTPFKLEDLKNCRIGNLIPKDHYIIQPFLFSLGYEWGTYNTNRMDAVRVNFKSICIIANNRNKAGTLYSGSNNVTHEIKKETILNYINQLNTNKNEQVIKSTEITQESRRISGRCVTIPTITGRITSASRLIGNKASGKCIKSHFRSFKISENIITC